MLMIICLELGANDLHASSGFAILTSAILSPRNNPECFHSLLVPAHTDCLGNWLLNECVHIVIVTFSEVVTATVKLTYG